MFNLNTPLNPGSPGVGSPIN